MSRANLKDYFQNTLYLLSGRIFFLVSDLIVGLLLARYLGPSDFGLFAYILAIFYVLLSISKTGLDPIMVKFLVRDSDSHGKIIGTSIAIRITTSLLILLGGAISLIMQIDAGELIFILILVLIPSSLNVLSNFYQAIVRAKYQVLAEVISKFAGLGAKVFFVILGFPLEVLIWILFFEYILLPLILVIIWKSKFDYQLTYSMAVAKKLMRQAWPMMFTGIAVVLHMRVDQLMVKNLIDNSSLGFYAAAIKLSESWYFIPGIITTSFFPKIMQSASFDGKLEKIIEIFYSALIYFSLATALVVTVIADPLVNLLYGEQYASASPILRLYIWSGIFVSINYVSLKYYHALDLEKIKFLFTIISLTINIVLNYILISRIGILGGAWATLISLFISSFVLNYLNNRTRVISAVIIQALNPMRLARSTPFILKYIKMND